ncbi:hypothetical protein TSUD_265640 [Trifolium subterraneum]|uniref:COI1 F-box domain-containing protein n=1 Tax=Trifolium subterraneum TaxID=3900 RepID=A0A2Z6M3J2_TRISU|nr:hypothetical protein TSUD_265640 [Trifolium subterraneum]
MKSIDSTEILIADRFPLLEELDLSYGYPFYKHRTKFPSIVVETISLQLFKLRKVNLSFYDYINDKLLFHLFKNCKLLEEANFSRCRQLTNAGIASALLERPTLKSLSFHILQDWAMLSAFTRNCPSLSEIRVQHGPRVNNVENINSFVFLTLEVLNLTNTSVDDNTLHVISKCCCGLLQLILANCRNVTERGVKHVVENCTQLKVINLNHCFKVDAEVAALILHSRPSLIKIIAPPRNMHK